MKLKKKTYLMLALAALAASSAGARTLSPAEALARAAKSSQAAATGTSRGHSVLEPVMTIGADDTPAVYVFTPNESGYLIVSADDVAAPVLGYSDNGIFDPEKMSPSMRWWLEEYSAQIRAAAAENAGSYEVTAREDRDPIGPLLQTKWDQGEPYNNYCPIYEYKGKEYPTYTGCVATAMAQVMKYHNWPDKAASNANFSYTWESKTLTASFGNYAFDWSNMLPDYSAVSSTRTQQEAVAKLMQACGYSVKMGYGPSASGASSAAVGGALANYFKYDGRLRNELRHCYTLADWETMIYNSLQTDGPVLYSGSNRESGHCFVCDGYRGNGYFHINWGWSGMSDGYFLLNALDPDQQGAGGSTSGYNSGQEILIGIRPATSTSSLHDIKFVALGNISAEISGSNFVLYGDFANFSIDEVSGYVSLRITDQNGKDIKIVDRYTVSDYSPGSYYPSVSIPLSYLGISDGTYRIYPVFKIGSAVYPYQCSISQPDYVLLSRSGSNYSVSTPSLGNYSVIGLTTSRQMYSGCGFRATGLAKFSVDMEATMPVYGLLLRDNGTVLGHGCELNQLFSVAGEPFDYYSEWFVDDDDNEISVTPGSYKFAMGYKSGSGYKVISDQISVTVSSNPGTPSLQVVGWNVENASAVDPDNVVINVTLKCQSGYLAGRICAAFFGENDQYASAQLNSPLLMMNAGDTQSFVISGSLTGFSAGELVDVGLYNGNSFISSGKYLSFTIGERSGIADVIADGANAVTLSPNPAVDHTVISASAEISRVDLYSLSGKLTGAQTEIDGQTARVDLSALPSGLYIARVLTADGVRTVKVIKK